MKWHLVGSGDKPEEGEKVLGLFPTSGFCVCCYLPDMHPTEEFFQDSEQAELYFSEPCGRIFEQPVMWARIDFGFYSLVGEVKS